ncbi:hypothetical protein KSP39_PZI009072 [Platanthera zijinensis]|uniref:J domain-containing protein n=1 Tax=Platanthera zijinensis TaxID=2320716 RepID=A0AAP0BKL8_9ASPA
MWNRSKLYAAAKILNGALRPRPYLAQVFYPLPPPRRVCSEDSLFHRDSKIFDGSLHHFHLFRIARCTIYSGSPYSTSPGHGDGLVCWKCGEPAPLAGPFLSCVSCRAVQPVDSSVDYFQIFGQERRYELKGENLERIYKEWQKKLHPDLVHSKSEKEKSYADEQSARVIDAYRTLSEPLSRALYLLQLAGILVDEENTIGDPELLAEMMDVREAIEEASDQKTLKEIQSQIRRKHQEWSKSFKDAFDKRDFDFAIIATQRMRYYERAIEEIVKKL